MKISIAKAEIAHLGDCKAALLNSKLGEVYFPEEESAISTLTQGIAQEEFYVALDDRGEFLGFIWFTLNGAFHGFPYLHIIAVKQEFRGRGVGKTLLAFFEDAVFPKDSKAFLVVADFNPDAKRLYERLGYRQVGEIPGLYKDGVTEYLMMKVRAEGS